MLETVNSPEICRLSLVIGAFASVHYKDRYGVIPGGIIVPGFIPILFLNSPLWCFSILALSYPTYWIYKRLLDRTHLKRRTPMYLLACVSLAMGHLVALLYTQLGWLDLSLDSLSGTIIPAVIAFTFTRQKMQQVVKGIVVTTLVTAATIFAIYYIGSHGLGIDFETLIPAYPRQSTLNLKYPLLQFYIALGVGYLIYHFSQVRAGGYMVAPIAAVLFIQPISAFVFLVGCVVIYGLTQLICQGTLMMGLKRYAMTLSLCTAFVWAMEHLFLSQGLTTPPFQGSNIFVIIAMMSYVNDAILYEKHKFTLPSMALGVMISMMALVITQQLPSF